jgi:hypothetical protein
MTQLDELLRERSDRVPIDDDAERRALDHARHTLQAATVAPPPPRVARRRRARRRTARLALAAGLAAAIVGVLASLPGGSGNDVGHFGPATASARTVLERAAQAVAQQTWHPLKPGQWLYFRQLGSNPGHNGPASARANSVEQVWLAANGAARIVQRPGVVSGGDVLLFHHPRGAILSEQRRQRVGSHLRVMTYGQRYYWGAGPDYTQLVRLPTDPDKLRRWIERNAINPGSTCAPGLSDCQTFSFVEALVAGGPLPPKLSAALYRVIADLPGMRLIGATRDPLGRPGIAVGYVFKHQPGRAELIFNPTTGVFLAEREISLDPMKMHAPAGAILSWTAIEHAGVVSSEYQPTVSRKQ